LEEPEYMKARTVLVIAIFDALFFALTIYYAAKVGSGNIDAMMGILMFYLTLVIIALVKLSGWHYILSTCIYDERKEREDTDWAQSVKGYYVLVRSVDPIEDERRNNWYQ
jgi:hypothetical protein